MAESSPPGQTELLQTPPTTIEDSPIQRRSDFKFIVRALESPNYRLFFGGQIVSLIGTWLTTVATAWLVYQLAQKSLPGKEPFVLGVVAFAGQIPLFILAPFGGVFADRWNQHRVLVITQTLSMLQSFALAFLALGNIITIPEIVLLNFFQGVVNSFDIPTRQAFVVQLVDRREDLGNAIALNSSMVHCARLIGPAIAGLLIRRFQPGICFLIDGFSYLAVILALLAMRLKPFQPNLSPARRLHALKEGIRYAWRFEPIRALLLLAAVTSLALASQSVLMPIFADKVLGGREQLYGSLLTCSGIGAFLGSIYLASRRSVMGLGRIIAWANASLGTGMVLFSISRSLWLSMPLLVLVGGAMVIQLASINTVLQTLVDDDKRGRVMSLFAMAFMGMMPFGSLIAGNIAPHLGVPQTVTLAGAVCIISGVAFALHMPALRQTSLSVLQVKSLIPLGQPKLPSAPPASRETDMF